jgi:excisionase family DNA binding protein
LFVKEIAVPRKDSTPTIGRLSYTVKQVADRLGISEQAVHIYIRTGQLNALRTKQGVRISESSLQAFLKTTQVTPAELYWQA